MVRSGRMGLFLDLLGVASNDSHAVERALRQYVTERGGTLILDDTASEHLNTITIADAPQHKVSLVHSGSYTSWDAVAAYLSIQLAAPVFTSIFTTAISGCTPFTSTAS
jgi:hypothetical protein